MARRCLLPEGGVSPSRTRRRPPSRTPACPLRVPRWEETLGEYILDCDDLRAAPDPCALAIEFARSAFRHRCLVCGWDTGLAASAEANPPPVR